MTNDGDRSGPGTVVARTCGWGAAAGAAGGAMLVTPLVVWNGPLEALLIYPPLAAVPGAAVGTVVGVLVGLVRVSARRNGAAAAGGTTSPGSSRVPGR